MSKPSCLHCFVSGKVQGVWFRANTKEQAEQLGLTGWTRNLPDGRVEVMAYGDKDKLKALHKWLHKGPPLANVTEVAHEELPWEACEGFEVR